MSLREVVAISTKQSRRNQIKPWHCSVFAGCHGIAASLLRLLLAMTLFFPFSFSFFHLHSHLYFKNESGLSNCPPDLISKCKCGPVDLPVDPITPKYPPLATDCPTETPRDDIWAYKVW